MILFSIRKIVNPAIFAVVLLSANAIAQQASNSVKKSPARIKATSQWTTAPFDHKVFIENKGQFNAGVPGNDKVIYSASLGAVNLYFTSHGIVYEYDEYIKNTKDKFQKPVTHYLDAEWENSNPAVTVTAEQRADYYYTYPSGKNGTIKANIFRKIVYHNLYPGIDVAYYFPENKDGYEYDIIVHPGADISQVKLHYDGALGAFVDGKNNARINSPVGEITEHAPKCWYDNGGDVKVSYKINAMEEQFKIAEGYDKNKTVVIDPWTTNPNFTGSYNKAYELDYDNNGNVYVYGGYSHFQLVKLNSSGVIQWVFPATSIDGQLFGGFTVDKSNGTSYLAEGADASGCVILEVNTAGNLVTASAHDAAMKQFWRPMYNSCNNNLIIGAGDATTTTPTQATVVDLGLTTFNNVNILGATIPGHTISLAALDPSGQSCYMAVAKSAFTDQAHFDNVLVKLPLATNLSPTTYIVPDGYKFVALSSIGYVGPPGVYNTNAMNGMAASLNWLYLYDGGMLKRFNKNTGLVIDSVKVSGSPYMWGGLDADICDNVYAGSQTWISVYNSSMTLADTINLPDTVYDVRIGANRQILYACGNGFVKSINIPFKPLTIDSTNATCTCNGTATANLCGGADTSKVTYLWSNGMTTQTITGLCRGKYNVTVTLGLCVPQTYSDSVTIAEPPVLDTAMARTNIKCYGGTGSATVTITGGAKPYTYSWSPYGGTNATADSLVPGTYTVTVHDANNCTIIDSVTIIQPNPFTVTASSTTANCGLSNGSASATVTGGTKPFTYLWTPSGQTTATAVNLPAGIDSVIVTDANGCTAQSSTIVPDAGVSPVTIRVTGEKCNGGNTGAATDSMIGGTPNYTYLWMPGSGTSETDTNLLGGVTYTVTIKDANGCVVTDTVTIPQPNPLVINMEPTNVQCNDSSNGSIIAAVTGGTSPYSYSWSDDSISSSISNLNIGTYTVTVTDANGCVAIDSATITQPPQGLKLVIDSQKNVACNGGCTGSATISATGGTTPYIFNWTPMAPPNYVVVPAPNDSSTSADSLCATSYTIKVLDQHGCLTSISVTLLQPAKVVSDSIIESTNNKCRGDSLGTAVVGVSGGVTPYAYSWSYSIADTTDSVSGLPAGTYNVTVTDSDKCTATASVTITQPPPLSIIFSTKRTACDTNIGEITAVVAGGPYTFSWNNGEATQIDTDLAAGVYTVTITDTIGCKTNATDTVKQSNPPSVAANFFPATCGSANGSAYAIVSGGVPGYTYSWGPSGETSDTATALLPGFYTVVVKDSYGCKDSTSLLVGDSGVSAPFSVVNDISCFGLSDGSATVTMSENVPSPPYTYQWSNGQTNSTATGLGLGKDTVTVTDSKGCIAIDTITITQPPQLIAGVENVTNVLCYDQRNGGAMGTATGGTAPYTYKWSDGEKGDTAHFLADSTYTVIATDANGCIDSATVSITQPDSLIVSMGTTAATCQNNGTATATGHGGTPPYIFSWIGPSGSLGTGTTIFSLFPGLYTVTVTDSNGCPARDTGSVLISSQKAFISSNKNVNCYDSINGSATVSVVGGDSLLYSYKWSPVGNTNDTVSSAQTATKLPAGVYMAIAEYIATGCADTAYDTISQPSKIVVSLKDSITCNSASAQAFVAGGVPPYTYIWNSSPSQTTATANLQTGNYTLTVMDNNNCPDTITTKIVVPMVTAKFIPKPDTIAGGEYVYFDNTSTGADSWYWTFGNDNSSDIQFPYQQYMTDGKYEVYLYVSNAKGCRDSVEEIVYVKDTLYVPNVFTPGVTGSNGAFHITAGSMKEYDLIIYNRWGEKIFESNSPNIDWTGTSDAGVAEPDGTYYYILTASDYDGKTYNLKGYVQLIR
ncbi:MAG: gliding motility-associated C-terminal domain-containing protein [Bacteroidia bacterium]